jgi:hypothetical protein
VYGRVAFPSTRTGAAEERMLREDLVREIARRERGESTRCIAQKLGVDRKKTIRRPLRFLLISSAIVALPP